MDDGEVAFKVSFDEVGCDWGVAGKLVVPLVRDQGFTAEKAREVFAQIAEELNRALGGDGGVRIEPL